MYCIHKKNLILTGVVLLVISLFILTSLLQNHKQTISTKASFNPICGGTEVTSITEYPFMAALLYKTNIVEKEIPGSTTVQYDLRQAQFCAGTFISPYIIVTAAHCVEEISDPRDILVLGNTRSKIFYLDRMDKDERFFNVDKIVIHEEFSRLNSTTGINNDIALLRLAQPNTHIITYPKIPRIPVNEAMYEEDTQTTALGWGQMEDGNYPVHLHKVDLSVFNNDIVNSEGWYNGVITNTMMAAGYSTGGKDTCCGDSGGPLLYRMSHAYYLLGITSWGDICGQINRPGIYTRVISYEDWINSTMLIMEEAEQNLAE